MLALKKTALILCILCLFSSCSSQMNMFKADSQIRKIKANMSKNEVVSVMGKTYEVLNGTENTLTLGYYSANGGTYVFYFVDNKLKEWNKERPMPHPSVVTTIVNEPY